MPVFASTRPSPFPPESGVRRLRVLYAEDLPELRELMRLMLRPEGHVLESCPDGKRALARLHQPGPSFDLLITDHHMPGMNGLELVRAVRQLSFAGRIIVFSSELNPYVHDEYVALGVDQVLAKPVRSATLRQLLVAMFPAQSV